MIDAAALRTWGIAVSAALMAIALAIGSQPTPATQPAPAATSSAEAERAPVTLLVRFRGEGPIARAQTRARRGEPAAAQRAIEVQLQRQRGFAGLCFDRFTAGAAGIVLRTCEPVSEAEHDRARQDWLTRLRAMPAVANADANATASPGRAG